MAPVQSILIIDDNTSIRTLLDVAFTHAGYTVTATGDGQSALTLAEQGGFTAILLDLKMPRMDGLTFLREISQTQPTTPNGPVIVFTSLNQDELKQQALDSGAAAYYVKDEIDLAKLPQLIQPFLSSAHT